MFTLLLAFILNASKVYAHAFCYCGWYLDWSLVDARPVCHIFNHVAINRDQILAFTMGPAAFYFGAP